MSNLSYALLPSHGRSIYYGLSGEIYSHLRRFELIGETPPPEKVKSFISETQWHEHSYNLPLANLNRKDISDSFFLGPLGEIFTRIVLNSELGTGLDQRVLFNDLDRFAGLIATEGKSIDVLSGVAGKLIACSLIRERLNGFCPKKVIHLAENMNDVLLSELQTMSPKRRANLSYGFAHGLPGLLYALLLWNRDSYAIKQIAERIDGFIRLGSISRNEFCVPFLHANNNNVSVLSWCNGSAGHILMLLLAYERTRLTEYLSYAEMCGNFMISMSDRLFRDNSLCCGIAGEIISLSQLFNVTSNSKIIFFLTHHLIPKLGRSAPVFFPKSLYLGNIGTELIKLEVNSFANIKFPYIQ